MRDIIFVVVALDLVIAGMACVHPAVRRVRAALAGRRRRRLAAIGHGSAASWSPSLAMALAEALESAAAEGRADLIQDTAQRLAGPLDDLADALAREVGRPMRGIRGASRRRRSAAALRVLAHIPIAAAFEPVLALALSDDEVLAPRALAALATMAAECPGGAAAAADIVRGGGEERATYAAGVLRMALAHHPPLLPVFFADPSANVRRLVIDALAEPAPSAGVPLTEGRSANASCRPPRELRRDGLPSATLPAAVADGLLTQAAKDGDPGVREAAQRAIGRLRPSQADLLLQRGAEDPTEDVRAAAAVAAARLDCEGVIPRLLASVERGSPALGRTVLSAFRRFRRLPVDALFSRATSDDLSSRLAAMRALGESADADVAPGLARFMFDVNAAVRQAAAAAVAGAFRRRYPQVGDSHVVGVLLTRLRAEPDESVVSAVIEALEFSGDARVPGGFAEQLSVRPPWLKERLVEGLAMFEHAEQALATAGAGRRYEARA